MTAEKFNKQPTMVGELFEVIEVEETEKYHARYWGGGEEVLTYEEIQELVSHLINGKVLAYNDGEYSLTIRLKGDS